MEKHIQSLMVLVAITFFVACTSENSETVENESNTKLMTFTATQDGAEAGTKAALAVDKKTINWEAEDKISVLYGTANQKFTLTSGEETSTATFQGSAETSDTYTAVYPYCSSAKLESDGTVSGITLPATQTATPNGFDRSAALMIAKSDNTTLLFKNVVGYVKVMPKFECSQIILSAAGGNEYIAGKGTLSYNSEAPTITFSSDQSTSITLKPSNGESTITAGTYYIAVPAVALNAGWSISFTTTSDSKIYTRKGSNPITFTRNKVINLGEFDLTATYWELEKNGEVPAEKQIDMGEITVNETRYRLICAQNNLTATGLAANDYDYGDYFAWGATEPWYESLSPLEWKTDKARGYTEDNCPTYGNNHYVDVISLGGETVYRLMSTHDAARILLGGDWQMPTKEIWEALNSLTNYSWDFTTHNSINGYSVKSNSTNQSIFLPAAGYIEGTQYQNSGQFGYYWSSSTTVYGTNAYSLQLGSSILTNSDQPREHGHSIRPVRLIKIEQ